MGCTNQYVPHKNAKGMCGMHYSRWIRYGDPLFVKNVRHSKSDSPEYYVWAAMKARCSNPKIPNYDDYGGRGITVCERWRGRNGFTNFLADMGPRPSRRHSIDRYPDNDGNYEPSNCRWATRSQQNRNLRTNHLLTFKGETKTITEWAEVIGVNKRTLMNRIINYKWPVERALTEPVGTSVGKMSKINYNNRQALAAVTPPNPTLIS
jgi:hypothetical protein